MTAPGRGSAICRSCQEADLASVLDLGEQPLANELATSPTSPDPHFPLHLRICRSCGMGQVGEFAAPERIFGPTYPYFSSVSTSWLAHVGQFVRSVCGEFALTQQDLVVEVASNDGYLLGQVRQEGPRVLGVEPAGNVAEVAIAQGIPTIVEFFGLESARRLVEAHGHPRLVVANNVLAHVPDLHDFVSGLAHLCGDDTAVTVENPRLVTLLRETQFDTIYHEHFSYLSAHSVSALVELHGLALVRVESLATHGGSTRYWLSRRGSRPAEPTVQQAIDAELTAGLLDEHLWESFARRTEDAIGGLRTWLEGACTEGRTVVAYGAAAKGATLLNAAGTTARDVRVVADNNRHKQGLYLPGCKVPIVDAQALSASSADDVIILPWNISAEILPLVRESLPRARYWTALPQMRQLA